MTPSSKLQIAATAYEQSLPLEERRRTGTVYTPAYLVEFILDQAGYRPDAAIECSTLLDPACGCGVFLEHAVRRLARRHERLSGNPEKGLEVESLLTAIETNLFGLDKDKHATKLAIELVQHTVAEIVGAEAVPRSFFSKNIEQGSFLDAPRNQLELFAPVQDLRSFDFIVGNPPYVTTTRLTSEEKELLRQSFTTARGRIDLYSLFFERGLELLKQEGALAFITPDKFLTSESAAPLRKLIATYGTVRSVARFRSHRVFDGAATVPCITVVEKSTRPRGPLVYLELSDPVLKGHQRQQRVEVAKSICGEAPSTDGEAWHFLDPALQRIAAMLTKGHQTLEKVSHRISAGIATGRDQIFVIPPGSEAELEPELLHPVVRGQDLKPFKIEACDGHLIVPYAPSRNGQPQLVNMDDFPRTYSYLGGHREELESRHCVRRWGKTWFDLHDPWTLNITTMPKILFPDLANSSRFVLDEGRYCPLHSAYYILPRNVDPEYLVAILNSAPLEFLVRLHAPLAKDGFSRYRKQFVKNLPIPQQSTQEMRQIARLARRGDLELANEAIRRSFGLSLKDLVLIDRFITAMRGPVKTKSTSRAA